MTDLSHILEKNARWAAEHVQEDPDYFARHSTKQDPELLWIGCSDSRVPADLITGQKIGKLFVHRNIGNLVSPGDLNGMSVLQYAVDTLKVKHIVVCGHYGCGGVKAALSGAAEGSVEHWLEPLRQLERDSREHLAALPDDAARINFICEANVCAQVYNLAHSPIVRRARERGQHVTLHGWIYGTSDGTLRDLECDEADVAGERFGQK